MLDGDDPSYHGRRENAWEMRVNERRGKGGDEEERRGRRGRKGEK